MHGLRVSELCALVGVAVRTGARLQCLSRAQDNDQTRSQEREGGTRVTEHGDTTRGQGPARYSSACSVCAVRLALRLSFDNASDHSVTWSKT